MTIQYILCKFLIHNYYALAAGHSFSWRGKRIKNALLLPLVPIKKRPPERSLSIKLKLFSCVLLECFKFSSEFLGKLVAKLAVEFFDALSIFSPESLINVED